MCGVLCSILWPKISNTWKMGLEKGLSDDGGRRKNRATNLIFRSQL